MNNVEFINGIDAVINGLNLMKTALINDSVESFMNEPATSEESTETGVYTRKQLEGMRYNEFKKLAASLGVKCNGTRDEIIDRVLALNESSEDAPVEETAPVEEPVTEEKPKRRGRKKAVKEESVPVENTDEETVPVEESVEEVEDAFDRQAKDIAEDTDVKDIISALADVGIKATKKNCVQKLADALREGLIELDDDEDEEDDEDDSEEIFNEEVEESDDEDSESDESEEDESSDEEEISPTSYFSEYDPEGINDPASMSKKRAKAVEKKMEEIISEYEDENLSDDDIADYINDHASSDEIDSMGDDPSAEECFKMYMELIKRTIDDDGDEHEPSDPYEIDGHEMCCGHELKYAKKTGKYVCEYCGAEYEAE